MSDFHCEVARLKNVIKHRFVVRPTKERIADHFGRVVLKMVGQGYLLRKNA